MDEQNVRHVPMEGDVLYSRELSFGWAVVVPEDVQLCLSQGMVVMRPSNEIDLQYFTMVLNSPFCRNQAISSAKGIRSPHVNMSDIRTFLFPIPPLEEQRRIVKRIGEIMNMCDQLERGSISLHTMHTTLMDSLILESLEVM
jgi:type I restriction enzyme S subunit